jgi:hypothetical protein
VYGGMVTQTDDPQAGLGEQDRRREPLLVSVMEDDFVAGATQVRVQSRAVDIRCVIARKIGHVVVVRELLRHRPRLPQVVQPASQVRSGRPEGPRARQRRRTLAAHPAPHRRCVTARRARYHLIGCRPEAGGRHAQRFEHPTGGEFCQVAAVDNAQDSREEQVTGVAVEELPRLRAPT